MFEDILGNKQQPTSTPFVPEVEFGGCPFCGKANFEEGEDGFDCNDCGGSWS